MTDLTPTSPTRRVAAIRIEIVRERNVVYPGDAYIKGPGDIARVARAMIGDADREAFLVVHVHVGSKHKINAIEVTAVGTLNATLVSVRETFKGALLANAAAVGLCHLHPSGDSTPSPEDIALTRQLLVAGEILGIRVLDHVTLGDPGYTSIRETTGLWQDYPFHR